MSQTPKSYTVTLAQESGEQAARLAQARGEGVEDYLSALLVDALARREAEEAPAMGPDSLGFWEQAMERHWSEPQETHPATSRDPPETGG